MKAYIIQPYYSFLEDDLNKCFQDMLALLDTRSRPRIARQLLRGRRSDLR